MTGIVLQEALRYPLTTFGPVVENPSPEAFLIESPEMAYSNRNVSNVPTLIGCVRDEGDFISARMKLLPFTLLF